MGWKGIPPSRTSKYGNQKTEIDGIIFASKAEGRRYSELKLLERGGFIRDLKRQTGFHFMLDGESMFIYLSDFDYWEGCTYVIEDTKGVQTPVFRLKRKLIEKQHRIKIRLT